MMRRKSLLLVFVVLALVSTYLVTGKQASFRKPVSVAYDLPNFHIVAPGVLRGAQPTREGFRRLKEDFQVKTILSLRNEAGHNEWEKKITESLGMNFISVPMSGIERQGIQKIDRCLEIINDKANQPIFVHCLRGKDRTGLIFAAYRIKYGNWNLDDAFREMLAYGYDRVYYFLLEESLMEWYKARSK